MALPSDIPTRTNGPEIEASWFNILRTVLITLFGSAAGAGISPTWIKYTVTHTQLQTAGLTNNITLLTLPALGFIHAIAIKHSTAFAGTGITAYEISVGITGTLDKYAGPFDVLQAVGATAKQTYVAPDLESTSGTTDIKIAATSVGANLSASTQGSVDIYVLQSALPAA